MFSRADMLSILKKIIIISAFISFIPPSYAETVHIDVSDSITASAEYYPGDKNKPVVLILHGFLLTHNFPTVKRLAESLNESGYNVLTPSLSLGISQRKKSLACEAIHTHSLGSDISEIEHWIKWLEKKSNTKITLIGHSAGSKYLAHYLNQYSSDLIKEVIFIAISSFELDSNPQSSEMTELQNKAELLVSNRNNSLNDFKLSYCKTYPSNAENFLSYLQLSKENITDYINNISIPKTLIIGSEDNRIDLAWSTKMTEHGVNVININDANHFYDDEHEFDLLDIIEKILSKQL